MAEKQPIASTSTDWGTGKQRIIKAGKPSLHRADGVLVFADDFGGWHPIRRFRAKALNHAVIYFAALSRASHAARGGSVSVHMADGVKPRRAKDRIRFAFSCP